MARHTLERPKSVKAAISSGVEWIASEYEISELVEVEAFLLHHPILIDALVQLPTIVEKHFGDGASISLRLITEMESDELEQWLVATVLSPLPPEDAKRRLRQFDGDWLARTDVETLKYLLVMD